MQTKKIILHCDVNNFFASCECALNPSIKDQPVAVTGEVTKRNGIVLAKNEIAKRFGIKTGDVIFEAKRKCPDLVCVRPHHKIYERYSRQIRAIYEEYTDKVEPFGIDECWLDITDTVKFFGSALDVANTLRERIKNEIGVTISVGISFSKTFAKLGSDMKKPDAVTVLSKENFKQKTYHLPLGSIIGIGKKLETKLNKLNIFTLGDLAEYDENIIKKKFGIVGERLQKNVQGIDDDDVQNVDDRKIVKSVGNGTTTLVDVKNKKELRSVVMFLCDEIATRLRAKHLTGSTISVSLRRNDLIWLSKSHTILKNTNSAKDIYHTAMDIIDQIWNEVCPLRSIRISVSNLDNDDISQLDLFNTDRNRKNLENAIDKIRQKYGYNSIRPLLSKDDRLINSQALRIEDDENENPDDDLS